MTWRIERHAVLNSTNTRALEMARAELAAGNSPAGIVVVAERQTAGRGQHGRAWESPAGGLYFSAVVDSIPIGVRDRLALIAAAAALSALGSVGVASAGIWWPNDLMVGDRKLGGILCESIALGQAWAAVVGIGINVQTPLEALSPELRGRAASLADRGVNAEGLLEVMLRALEGTIEQVHREGLVPVLKLLSAHDTLRGQSVTLEADGRHFAGVAAGIDDRGDLRLKVDGEMVTFPAATLISVAGRVLRSPTA